MSRIAANTFWLVLAQIGGLFISLIELPILSRALGQQGYGQILYVLGIAITGSIFVEFGFNFSAVRSTIKARDNKRELAQLVTDVLVAKLLLYVIVVCVIGITIFTISDTMIIPSHWFIWIFIFIFAFGFTPLWYYIGIEKLFFPILLDLCLRSIGLILVIMLVSSPLHSQRVLTIQAIVGIINSLLPTLLMIRSTGLGRLSLRGTITIFREGWELFLYKGAQSVVGSISAVLLGWFGGAIAIGAFVPAEKFVRAASSLMTPLFYAAFPHLVRLQSDSRHTIKKVACIVIGIFFLISVIFASLTAYLASWIINIVFGSNYQDTIEILILLIWIVPLRICSMGLAILWFIPGGNEVITSRLMILNIVIICITAFLLIPELGGLGMAISFLIAEVIMFSLLLFFFFKKRLEI